MHPGKETMIGTGIKAIEIGMIEKELTEIEILEARGIQGQTGRE